VGLLPEREEATVTGNLRRAISAGLWNEFAGEDVGDDADFGGEFDSPHHSLPFFRVALSSSVRYLNDHAFHRQCH
jgi:hypothetical protein